MEGGRGRRESEGGGKVREEGGLGRVGGEGGGRREGQGGERLSEEGCEMVLAVNTYESVHVWRGNQDGKTL
jgi:hypothetical protein